ncbi:hypothetical protein OGATHE_000344 [Ogataea polymorpha]|uniref:Uncharacterized protein n=1 Tax=Ogataea polymorpha TaxID=460523 RepID=A0A9P8TGF6_9ASCO|nr:hypothetical protein OGATHE_000344 [Ogataea polymorpha]
MLKINIYDSPGFIKKSLYWNARGPAYSTRSETEHSASNLSEVFSSFRYEARVGIRDWYAGRNRSLVLLNIAVMPLVISSSNSSSVYSSSSSWTSSLYSSSAFSLLLILS